MTDAHDALLNFIKTHTLCPSNQMGLRLFKIKLDRYLDSIEKTPDMSVIQDDGYDLLIRAIVNYGSHDAILRATSYNLFKDERLFEAALSIAPFKIYLPEDRWHPENFMVKANDKEIVPGLLEELAVKNEDETAWLLTRLCPNLDPASTFTIKKPMVLYVDPNNPVEDLEDLADSHRNEVKRFIIVIWIDDRIKSSSIERLVKLRMIRNVQVRICLCLGTSGDQIKHTNLHVEFMEWLSSKLQIPLIKLDLKMLSATTKYVEDHGIKILLKQIVSDDPNTRFDNELIWSYGLQEASTSRIIFSDIEVIYQSDLCKEQEKKASNKNRFDFLNNRNIPFLLS